MAGRATTYLVTSPATDAPHHRANMAEQLATATLGRTGLEVDATGLRRQCKFAAGREGVPPFDAEAEAILTDGARRRDHLVVDYLQRLRAERGAQSAAFIAESAGRVTSWRPNVVACDVCFEKDGLGFHPFLHDWTGDTCCVVLRIKQLFAQIAADRLCRRDAGMAHPSRSRARGRYLDTLNEMREQGKVRHSRRDLSTESGRRCIDLGVVLDLLPEAVFGAEPLTTRRGLAKRRIAGIVHGASACQCA